MDHLNVRLKERFISEETIPAPIDAETGTIPTVCMDAENQRKLSWFSVGVEIDGYKLISLMSLTSSSELWFAENMYGMRCVVKIARRQPDIGLFYQIRLLGCKSLAEPIDYGIQDGNWFEVYPYYRNGSVKGPVPEEHIRLKVLPGIINALESLHGAGIVHNDIKPENIFWSDDGKSVILGDFGYAGKIDARPEGFTPTYAAPEILLNGISGRAADWLSVGLTLAALAEGEPLLKKKSVGQILRSWERGICFTEGSLQFQRLINGLIQSDPKKRLGLNAAKGWCRGSVFGGEERRLIRKREAAPSITVRFDDPPWTAMDIAGLLKGIESHWEYAVFLFSQERLDGFLSQFDKKWKAVCQGYRKLPSMEDALFRLTLDLSAGEVFVWRGKTYHQLLDMEKTWEEGGSCEKDVLTFLKCGLACIYLKKKMLIGNRSNLRKGCRLPAE